MISIPYIELQAVFGWNYIGISTEEYTELLSKGLTANVLIIQDVNKNK